MNKRIILPILAVVAAGTIAVGATTVSAQSADESSYPSIVTKIAEHFNLNQDEVKAVFDETRGEHQADMEQKMEDRLTASVTAGELTEAQKQAIMQKHEEMQAEREANFDSWKNMTQEERRTAMETRHAEMEAWASEQGIDVSLLLPEGGEGRGPGGRGGMMGGKGMHSGLGANQ